jgi:hypothetical protein
MKQLLILSLVTILSIAISAQGNSQKGNNKSSKATTSDKANSNEKDNNDSKDRSDHEKKIWEGTFTKASNGPKPSKNQPAGVRVAFQRDYPNATNVYWSKYRGDWTATFTNGLWMSTAVYHANGNRRDTRTIVTRNEMPKVILDDIFKKKPDTKLGDIIKIEVPKVIKDIFRIKSVIDGKPQYVYYNSDGLTVQYNY